MKRVRLRSNFGAVVTLVMHKLAALVVGPQRGVTSHIAAFDRKIRAAASIVFQHLRRRSEQHQRLGMPGQTALGKASIPGQPTQCT